MDCAGAAALSQSWGGQYHLHLRALCIWGRNKGDRACARGSCGDDEGV